MQPSSSEDGEAQHKFPHFDTRVNILCPLQTEKAPELFIVCCSEFENVQNHIFFTADSDGDIAIAPEHRSASI